MTVDAAPARPPLPLDPAMFHSMLVQQSSISSPDTRSRLFGCTDGVGEMWRPSEALPPSAMPLHPHIALSLQLLMLGYQPPARERGQKGLQSKVKGVNRVPRPRTPRATQCRKRWNAESDGRTGSSLHHPAEAENRGLFIAQLSSDANAWRKNARVIKPPVRKKMGQLSGRQLMVLRGQSCTDALFTTSALPSMLASSESGLWLASQVRSLRHQLFVSWISRLIDEADVEEYRGCT